MGKGKLAKFADMETYETCSSTPIRWWNTCLLR